MKRPKQKLISTPMKKRYNIKNDATWTEIDVISLSYVASFLSSVKHALRFYKRDVVAHNNYFRYLTTRMIK